MIIGNGLIGKAFSDLNYDMEYTIFCSGVSNSLEKDVNNYIKEKNKLISTIDKVLCTNIVYFSTIDVCNVSDDRIYVHHKREMENYLRENCNSLIIRLPQVFGSGGNSKNIVNSFVSKIKNGEEIIIHDNTYKGIIDVSDVVRITESLIKKKSVNQTCNIAGVEIVTVERLVEILGLILDIKPKKQIQKMDKPPFFINDKIVNEIIFNDLKINKINYVEKTLKKYL